jgi:hypothetical protein
MARAEGAYLGAGDSIFALEHGGDLVLHERVEVLRHHDFAFENTGLPALAVTKGCPRAASSIKRQRLVLASWMFTRRMAALVN